MLLCVYQVLAKGTFAGGGIPGGGGGNPGLSPSIATEPGPNGPNGTVPGGDCIFDAITFP